MTMKELVLEAVTAKDSRGRDTVEVRLRIGDVETVGDVPAACADCPSGPGP